jgi:RNA polymerase I-specific transcription initiation factor RRN3
VKYEQTKCLFRDLLNIFNKILLPTHDSSHVQFLLFYICSFHTVKEFFLEDEKLIESFVSFKGF